MTQSITTTCSISGGGPAGLMLGLLLARAGVDVTVLEKHKDFLRDFRGDTIHPSTMQTIDELGLLEEFLKLPHQPARRFSLNFGHDAVQIADFSRLSAPVPYIAMMPQWDFLNFISAQASAYPNFRLLMETEAKELIFDGEKVVGIRAEGPDGSLAVHAPLTIAADGRGSVLRSQAGLTLEDHGAPIDVLWFRVSRQPTDPEQVTAQLEPGSVFVSLNRGDYWQCAYVINKGANALIREGGLSAFRDRLRPLTPFAPERVDELQSWDQIKLLSVQVNRLKKWWHPGFLCIGDAAHAMSPVGGVGVNLAIQDAVAAANLLARPLQQNAPIADAMLAAVQSRREWPTRMTQRLQLTIQNRILASALSSKGELKAPFVLKLITRTPGLRRMPSRLLGLGVRPEHIGKNLQQPLAA